MAAEDDQTLLLLVSPKNQTTKTYTRSVSNAHDELHRFRSYLRWMCLDQSNFATTLLSWSVFLVFAIVVPTFSHIYLDCPSCDAMHLRPYDSVVQLSLSSIATLSFFCLSRFVRKFGVRRFLFIDKLVDGSNSVRRHYTAELDVKTCHTFILLSLESNTNLTSHNHLSNTNQKKKRGKNKQKKMEDDEILIPRNYENQRKTYNRCISHAQDELQSYRSYLRWMCVDQSDTITTVISWSVFFVFAIIVPAFSHYYLECPSCDHQHTRPFDAVVQLSLSSIATLSFLCLSLFVRKYGVRRFLFFDKLVNESDSVRHHYTSQLDRSLNILSIFVVPCFVAECAYKIWWYASGGSQIPFLGNPILSDIVACSLELTSWIYRTLVFFLVCVLFRLICYLQILRLKDFATVFEVESDVSSILMEHLRIRRHLRIISHRYRGFILFALILITLSQLTFLLETTKPNADVSIFKAGELALCSMTLMAGLMIILRSATKITHKAQAITSLSAKWHVCATIDSFVTSETELPGFSNFVNPGAYSDDDDEAGSEEDDVDNTSFLPAYTKSSISFQKRHALVKYFERNKAGISLYGFMLDRTWLKLIFGVELSLVLWLLKVTVNIS